MRCFAKVTIEEPTVDDAIAILQGLKSAYEQDHRVAISDEAIVTAVTYAKRYLGPARICQTQPLICWMKPAPLCKMRPSPSPS